MKRHEQVWGWMLAVDFFFAGMGGGMLLVAGLADLLLGPGHTSLLGNFAGPVFIAIGSGFLILELGRPTQAWRVFLNPRAILTIGAWNMLAAIGAGLAYASFGMAGLPWAGWGGLRQVLALICILTGLVVATYPGALLGRHKARPFWTGPGIFGLFMLSSLVTGLAAQVLAALVLPASGVSAQMALRLLAAGVLGLQCLSWPIYLWVKLSGGTQREASAVRNLLSGGQARLFWVAFIGFASLLPLVLFLLPGSTPLGLAALLTLTGGGLMRWMVVRAGESRTWLPGEEYYLSKLPTGDEPFLSAWK